MDIQFGGWRLPCRNVHCAEKPVPAAPADAVRSGFSSNSEATEG